MDKRIKVLWHFIFKHTLAVMLILSATFIVACNSSKEVDEEIEPIVIVDPIDEPIDESPDETEEDFLLSNIDLNNWKVTLPITENGKLIEVEPPEILDYASNETLKPFMYNDSTDGALVFYTYPQATTANSSYSRTELREQMVPGSNNTNWTFSQGGSIKGTLSVPEISQNANGDYHRTMVMQIHGRLTNEQRDLIGENDNNAPPVLKIYWDKGKIRVKTKVLNDLNATYEEMLHTDAWGDDEGYNFPLEVDDQQFTLEVIVSEGRMEIILNDEQSVVYDDIHMEKWGIFENYFKAGNYLQTTDAEAHATVKYYDLVVTH